MRSLAGSPPLSFYNASPIQFNSIPPLSLSRPSSKLKMQFDSEETFEPVSFSEAWRSLIPSPSPASEEPTHAPVRRLPTFRVYSRTPLLETDQRTGGLRPAARFSVDEVGGAGNVSEIKEALTSHIDEFLQTWPNHVNTGKDEPIDDVGVITSKQHLLELVGAGGATVVNYHAPWCRKCRYLKPMFSKLAADYSKRSHGQIKFYSADVDALPNLISPDENMLQGGSSSNEANPAVESCDACGHSGFQSCKSCGGAGAVTRSAPMARGASRRAAAVYNSGTSALYSSSRGSVIASIVEEHRLTVKCPVCVGYGKVRCPTCGGRCLMCD